MNAKVNFKHNLPLLRKRHNLSQEQLADKLGISRQSISKWESGETYPEMKLLLELCDLFSVSLDELIHSSLAEQSSSDLSKKYDRIFTNHAKSMALGVGLILFGLASLMGIIGLTSEGISPFPQALSRDNAVVFGLFSLLVFTAVAVIVFIASNHQVRNFKDRHSSLPELYSEAQAEQASIKYTRTIAFSAGGIVIAFAIFLLLTFLGLHLAFVFTILTLLLIAPITAIVYASLQESKYNTTTYNRHNLPEFRGQEQLAGRINGVIISSAVVIHLLWGFLASGWGISWIVYPIAAVLCSIVNAILRKVD